MDLKCVLATRLDDDDDDDDDDYRGDCHLV